MREVRQSKILSMADLGWLKGERVLINAQIDTPKWVPVRIEIKRRIKS